MLSVIGLVLLVVLTQRVFKAAKETGRNAGLWAVANVIIGLGLQFIIPMLIGMVIGIVYVMQGRSLETLTQDIMGYAIVFSIVCLVLSIGAMMLVLKHVSKLPPDEYNAVPPPPPTFQSN